MRLMNFLHGKQSGSIAKDRLKLLLVSDRAKCSPEVMDMIKNDMVMILSQYIDIDKEELDIQITQKKSKNGTYIPALFANIPIKEIRKNVKKI
ncbi:MAG: cell division topological specificity factor MinE [Lachnospiraceae bacterium]